MILNGSVRGFVMVRLGKTYGNLMVDLQVTNDKLRKRAVRLVEQTWHWRKTRRKHFWKVVAGR